MPTPFSTTSRRAPVLFFAIALLQPLGARALEAAKPDGWTEATRNADVIVFFKENEKAGARDILAYSEFDASPEAAYKVATDLENYPSFMPYVKESKIFKKNSPTDIVAYQVMDVPLQPRRDYFLHAKFTKGTKANGGIYKSEWTCEPDTEPAKEGIVRMRLNEGFWSFAPLDGGKRTRATYSILTHPGGNMPKWMVDQSVGTIPNIINALRDRLKKEPKAPSAAH
jgi:ribosome-associated toxin RatA of RatAB toxin-antitoxin module